MADSLPNPEQPVSDSGILPSDVALPPVEDLPPAEAPSGGDTEPIISFKNVSIGFNGRVVLDDVSFYVDRGQTLCILGRSGVGKSVSLRMLMGFLKPDSGSIHVEGREITGLSENEMQAVRRRITMVFQNGALFDSMNVRENVAFPLRERGGLDEEQVVQIVDRLIKMVGADDVSDNLPSGLSTGRKRAVAIARALASQPEVVLYDEPTTMVDPIMADHTGNLILRLKDTFHRTSIVVTHDTHLAKKLADIVVFLQEGKATVFASWKDFENSKDPFLHNFRMQDELIPALDVTL